MKNILVLILLSIHFLCFSQTKGLISKCDKGYILNVNGKNRCIDTTNYDKPVYNFDDGYFHHYYYRPTREYSILMQIFEQEIWNKPSSEEDKTRILLRNDTFDTLYLFVFNGKKDEDSLLMTLYQMSEQEPPDTKVPGGISYLDSNFYAKKIDTVYYFNLPCRSFPKFYTRDRNVFLQLKKDWYAEHYERIRNVSYTKTEYKIPRIRYEEIQKNAINLQNYELDGSRLFLDMVLIESYIDYYYKLIRFSQSKDDELGYSKDKFFKTNRANLLNFLKKYM